MSKFVDTGQKLDKLAVGAKFDCSCNNGIVANGIALIGTLKEYQFQCNSCHHTYRMGPTGRLYKIQAG